MGLEPATCGVKVAWIWTALYKMGREGRVAMEQEGALGLVLLVPSGAAVG